MGLVHLRRVGEQRGNGSADANVPLGERRGETSSSCVGLSPREPSVAVNHRNTIWAYARAPGDEAERRQRRVVRGILAKPEVVGIRNGEGFGAVRRQGSSGVSHG